jgi:hypothetical protein
MKLNHDCVRDILLYLEETLSDGNYYVIESDSPDDTGISHKVLDVVYALERLDEAGYINAKIVKTMNPSTMIYVSSISWKGHEFLDTIRPQPVWDKTIATASKVGSTSLTVLSQIAVTVATQLISQSLGL